MFFCSILALSLFLTSYVSSESLNSGTSSPPIAARDSEPAVLGPVSRLRVTNKFISPDGFNRSATLYNGQHPAPIIQAYKGQKFNVEVVNELTDDSMTLETSVHFHGIFQSKSAWADGAAYVTQCPLRQHGRFVQKFDIAEQTGTYWYHSHVSAQRCSGARGPLIIYDDEDPLAYLYDVDDETTVITLSDWYHLPSVPSKVFGFPNSTLINGRGRYRGGPPAPLSVVNVAEGLYYRFRVIATSCESSFNFSIDGHRMTIIEVDGNEVSPVEVDSIRILVGQRYSLVVKADQSVGNYWIRALPDLPRSTFDDGQNMAILRYDGAQDQDPDSSLGPYELAFNEGDLHPLIDPEAPGIPELGKADVNLAIVPGFTQEGDFTLNNVTWVNPSVPVLLQMLSGVEPSKLLPQGSVYTLPANKVIEISFPNYNQAPGGPHPIHLHGNPFHVVRVAGSDTPNFVNPVRRDVVSMGTSPTDSVTIRFVTDNPGPWFLHCHLDYHFLHGFAVVMAVAPHEAAYQESRVVPEDWKELCQQQG